MVVYNKVLIFLATASLFAISYGEEANLKETEDSTLQLVHVLFRHGDRTTDPKTLYPNDPHINETYYPYGLGELTKKGKQKEYRLGKVLRERYDQFLGQVYTPDILEARSSDTNRTKVSLQLVLAGLFPPTEEEIWETGLHWHPIPFTVVPSGQDLIFLGLFHPCFEQHYSDVISSPKVQQEFQENSELFDYISEHTGKPIESYWDLFYLYWGLTTELEYGLPLPEWTKNIYPRPLEDFAIRSYGLLTATTELKRIVSGSLLKKIVDDSKAKVNNELLPKNRKIFLYSGHELNIAFLQHTLEVFEPHSPPYGAHLMFELHRIDGVDGFKIFYQDYANPEPRLLKLPACDEFCPLDQFIPLIEEYFPQV